MSILTEQPPESFTDEQREYLTRMLGMIDRDVSNSSIFRGITDLTSKPTEGKIYNFKNIPPSVTAVTAAGFWGYTNGAWQQL